MCETPLLLEHLRAGALARRVGKQGVYQRAGPLQAPWLSGYIRSIYQTPLLLHTERSSALRFAWNDRTEEVPDSFVEGGGTRGSAGRLRRCT